MTPDTRFPLLLLCLAALLFSAGCLRLEPVAGPIPESATGFFHRDAPYSNRTQEVLRLSGENAPEIESFLASQPQDSLRREAAAFLVAGLPPADAASMTAEELGEHLEYAFLARKRFPWGESVPWDIFLRYVLPHRAAQEPVEPWRKQLFQTLAPLLDQETDMGNAALRLALWSLGQTEYVTTSRRDQGPLTTMRRGKARCEEASVLFTAAARSVGIPARVVHTPAWQFADDNHAWAEVWVDGEWRYLDPANPSSSLDRAWFSENAAKAVLVLAAEYGPPGNQTLGDPLYREGAGHAVRNVTARYAPTHPLRVLVLGPDGEPLPEAKVYASVYNYASFRPTARIICDNQGRGEVRIGQSALLLTVAHQDRTDFAVVRVGVPENMAVTMNENPYPDPVVLDLRRNHRPEGLLQLQFEPFPPFPKDSAFTAASPPLPNFEEEKEKLVDERQARLKTFHTLVAHFLETKGHTANPSIASSTASGAVQDPEVEKKLIAAAGNAPEILHALTTAPPALKPTLTAYLAGLTEKDAAESHGAELRGEVESALEARALARNKLHLDYDDDLFRDFVLKSRISRYEPWSAYRSELLDRFGKWAQGGVTETVQRVNKFVGNFRRAPRSPLSPVMTPLQTVRSVTVASKMDRGVACVGILRSLGIPARYLEQWGWVEFHDGKRWQPLYPNRPEQLGNKTAHETAARYYNNPASLLVSFTLEGESLPPGRSRYFREFSLSIFPVTRTAGGEKEMEGEKEVEGFHLALEADEVFKGGWDETGKGWRLILPAGDYVLTAGGRNPQGEPHVRILPLPLEPDRTLTLQVPLDQPSP
jgi:hypothetical protein